MRFKRKWQTKLLMAAATAIALFWTLAPMYIVVSNSVRKTLEIKEMPPKLLFVPTWEHFQKVLMLDNFSKYFLNSMVIAFSTIVLTILAGTLAAYGLKICRSGIGRKISNVLLLCKMVPTITIMIPLFIMFNRVHLTGTYVAPVLAHCSLSLSFVTWLMANFMDDIPNELLEAASVMGCSRLGAFPRVVLPLLKPALASATILVMQSSWNELLFSLTLTNIKTYPLTVGVAKYVGALSVDWGKCSAAATLTIVPIVIVGFFMQKYLVSGMTAGAVKG